MHDLRALCDEFAGIDKQPRSFFAAVKSSAALFEAASIISEALTSSLLYSIFKTSVAIKKERLMAVLVYTQRDHGVWEPSAECHRSPRWFSW